MNYTRIPTKESNKENIFPIKTSEKLEILDKSSKNIS